MAFRGRVRWLVMPWKVLEALESVIEDERWLVEPGESLERS
jgi:hypothetical protein